MAMDTKCPKGHDISDSVKAACKEEAEPGPAQLSKQETGGTDDLTTKQVQVWCAECEKYYNCTCT